MEIRKEAGKGERENKSKSWGRNRFNSKQIVIYGRNKIQELLFFHIQFRGSDFLL